MSKIVKQDTNGVKALLAVGELGYDNYPAGGDAGRVYVGTGTLNIPFGKKTEIDAVSTSLSTHTGRVDNPHSVTKTQVGLSNVDNTSDVNKPISTAAQTALNGKQDLLVSGTSIKTIEGTSLLGSGNIDLDKTNVGLSNVDNTADSTKVVASAGKLTTARNISMSGGVTGTASFDGSGDVTISTTIANVGTAGTYTKVTTNAQGQVTSGTTLAASDVPALDASKITSGTIDAARLPAYVDDVLEFTNLAAFPITGETGKIYVALNTNKTYRWSGSMYVYITSGAVDSVAGKTGVVTLVKGDVGLGNVDNTSDVNKPISTAAQTALDTKVNKVTSTDNAITIFNGTTGDIQNSATKIDSTGSIILPSSSKIQGDFSNASQASRTVFQTSTINGITAVSFVPNGTANTAYISAHSTSDATNYSIGTLKASSTEIGLSSLSFGTAPNLPLTFYVSGSNKATLDTSGNLLLIAGLGGLGYGAGAGGTVTQLTNKSTAVTLNKPCGQITMNNSALATGTKVSFYMDNSLLVNGDLVYACAVGGSTSINQYDIRTRTGGGAVEIIVNQTSGSTLSDAVVIQFAIIKGVSA